MRCVFLVGFLACLSGPLLAQSWPLRDGDVPLTQADVDTSISGSTLTFYDDGRAKYSVGGSYSYTYANNGGTAFGQFDVQDDGQVCIAFANGFGRCDIFVRSQGRLVMLTQKGERYPVRPD